MSLISKIFKLLPGRARAIEKGVIDSICRYLDKNVDPNSLPLVGELGWIVIRKEREELIKQKLKIIKEIIHGLSININEAGVIKLSVLLNGEPGNIDLRIEYSKREANGSYFLKINCVHATKQWLVVALEQLVLPDLTKDSPTGEITIHENAYHLLP